MNADENNMKNDILFQIDMQLYDEFNDKIAAMNDHLGDIYSLKDVEEVEKAEKDKEIKLLRETIKKQQAEIENLKDRDYIGDLENQIELASDELEKKDKIINRAIEWIHSFTDNGHTTGCNLGDLQTLLDILEEETNESKNHN